MDIITHKTSRIEDGNMSFEHGARADVQKNRKTFFEKHNISRDRIVWASLEHGDTMHHVDETQLAAAVVGDALMCNTPNVFLALTTGDCIPVTLFDPEHEAIALVHLGWKSSMLHLLEKAVRTMVRTFDTDPGKLRVYFGPAIQFESYVMTNPEQKDLPEWQPFLEKAENDKYRINLVGFNVQALVDIGIALEHIDIDETDTYTSKEHFSHKRSQETGEPEGRMVTVVGIRP